MASRIAFRTSFGVALLMLGCASPVQAQPTPKTPGSESSLVQPTQPVATGMLPADTSAAAQAASAPAQDLAPQPARDPKTGAVARGLPELKLELSGLHIGGGPNDSATKRPFIETLESGFDALRVCYTQVEQPEKGGTFGVDLRVERVGGHPTLRSVRTVIKGDGFRSCAEEVFRALEFTRPAKGPTVLSASVRFSLE